MAMFVPTIHAYSIVAWGNDTSGQVSNTPSGNDFVDIAGGGMHSLALEDTTPIPEPSTLILFGIGILGGIGVVLRRKRRS